MADIFISYAREDLTRARMLALALENHGKTVWWDRTIPAGKIFDELIDEAIRKARCVIVLWSAKSAASRWVRTEAEEGAKRNILVPVLIEKTEIPLAFRLFQTADLAGWDGTSSSPSFQRLLQDVETVLGSSTESTIDRPQSQRRPPTDEQATQVDQPSRTSAKTSRAAKPVAARLVKACFVGAISFVIVLYASWAFIEIVSGVSRDSGQTAVGSSLVAAIATSLVLFWYWRRH